MSHDKRTLEAPAVPLLPTPGQAYDRRQIGDSQNSVRQFFIKVSNLFSTLLGPFGVTYIDQPNLLAFDLTDQTLAATNTGYAVKYQTTYLSNGISVVDNTKLTVSNPGIYNFNVSMQLESSNSSLKHCWFWLKRSGTTIGYSTRMHSLSGSGVHLVADWVFNIDMDKDDYMEIFWASDDTNVQLTASPASAPHPGIPSVVASVSFVGKRPHVLPTPP